MVPLTQGNSRLACQILWTPELDGLEVTLAPVSG
jgi:2Fe-2S ferredoxin